MTGFSLMDMIGYNILYLLFVVIGMMLGTLGSFSWLSGAREIKVRRFIKRVVTDSWKVEMVSTMTFDEIFLPDSAAKVYLYAADRKIKDKLERAVSYDYYVLYVYYEHGKRPRISLSTDIRIARRMHTVGIYLFKNEWDEEDNSSQREKL